MPRDSRDQAAFDRAVAAFDAGQLSPARRQFEALLLRSRGTPLNARVRYYLARIEGKRDKERGGAALLSLADRPDVDDEIVVLAEVEGAALWAESGRCDGVAPRIERRLAAVSGPLRVRATGALVQCQLNRRTLDALAVAAEDDPQHRSTFYAQARTVAAGAPIDELAAAARVQGGAFGALLRGQLETRAAAEGRPDLLAEAAPRAVEPGSDADPDPGAATGSGGASGGEVQLGLILPLTGRSQRLGERLRETGRRLYGGEDRPPGGPVLTVRDGGDPQAAAAAVMELKRLGAVGAIGVFDAATAQAAAQAAAEARLPLIMLTLSDAAVTGSGPTWRALHTPLLVARTAAGAALARGGRRAAVVHADDGYGRTLANWFQQAWQAGGGATVGAVTWEKKEKALDFAAIAKRIRALDADVLFVPVEPGVAAELLSHLASAKVFIGAPGTQSKQSPEARRVVVIGPPEWYDIQLTRQGGRYVEGALVPVPFAVETARGAELETRLGGASERTPNLFDALLADGMEALVQAAGRAQGSAELVGALQAAPYLDGFSSGLHFDQRDLVQALFLLEVKGGRFQPTQ